MNISAYRPKSPFLRLVWMWTWGPIALSFAFIPLCFINFMQLPSLLILPWSRTHYERWNRRVAIIIWGWWAWSVQNVVGMKVTLEGDALPDGEDAIVIGNHQGMSDIVIVLCIAMAKGRVGDVKWMVKDILKYVPGVGWGLLFLGNLFLKRDWAVDEANIRRTFKRYSEGALPLWLMSFPEGTRITPAKLDLSRAYARRIGKKETTHVLLPRPSGFVASLEGLRQRVGALYCLTIKYPDKEAPSLPALIRGEAQEVQVRVRRFEIGSMPRGNAALMAWLDEQFYAMDDWLKAKSSSC